MKRDYNAIKSYGSVLGPHKIYRKKCKFYRLKCKIYRKKCKIYRKKCKFYRKSVKFTGKVCKLKKVKCLCGPNTLPYDFIAL